MRVTALAKATVVVMEQTADGARAQPVPATQTANEAAGVAPQVMASGGATSQSTAQAEAAGAAAPPKPSELLKKAKADLASRRTLLGELEQPDDTDVAAALVRVVVGSGGGVGLFW